MVKVIKSKVSRSKVKVAWSRSLRAKVKNSFFSFFMKSRIFLWAVLEMCWGAYIHHWLLVFYRYLFLVLYLSHVIKSCFIKLSFLCVIHFIKFYLYIYAVLVVLWQICFLFFTYHNIYFAICKLQLFYIYRFFIVYNRCITSVNLIKFYTRKLKQMFERLIYGLVVW
jgi:hypothetical protein